MSVLPNTEPRSASFARRTAETSVELDLVLDGSGRADIDTGVGFLDHLLAQLARHGRLDIQLRCSGDLGVCDHHTVEDCCLALGTALDRALGERRGLRRFGSAYAPLDESLARAVVDLSGRPWPVVELGLSRERLGSLATENITHALDSFAIAARMNLHVDVLRGKNDHHRAEAAFKAVALALRTALELQGDQVPSTKEVLG